MFEVENVKDEAILRDCLQKWEVQCKANGLAPVPMRFAIFPLHLNLAPATKEWCQVIRSAARVTQNHLRCAKMQPLSGCLLSCTCHAKCIFPDPLQMSHAYQCFWNCYKTFTFCSLLARCRIPCACHAKPHLNLQVWSEHVFFTFWLGNMLRATTACTFSTFPKVVRTWCFVHFDFQTCFAPQRRATCRRSSRQLAPHPPRRFSEPTFRPSGATNHWKEHSVSQLFYIVAHLHLVSSHSFSSLIFSLLLFSSLTLPTFAFPSLHIVGSLTFKLPSVRYDIGYKLCHFLSLLFITSSIARGGGGSFENRKPIGDVGCCESRMVERTHWWSERWLVLWIWSGYNGCSCRHLTHNCWM